MSIYTGETVQLAIEKGLKQLAASKNDVEITILREEKKGFLGIGKKEAEVKIQRKSANVPEPQGVVQNDDALGMKEVENQKPEETLINKSSSNVTDEIAIEKLAEYLISITKEMGIPTKVRVEKEGSLLLCHLDTEKQGMLIGKHGKILNALQYLSQIYIHRIATKKLSVMVNIGDYREKRKATLQHLAEKISRQVEETGQAVFLEPMPAFERKQIHAVLSANPYIKTYSEGEEPFRYLVVEPSKRGI